MNNVEINADRGEYLLQLIVRNKTDSKPAPTLRKCHVSATHNGLAIEPKLTAF